MTNVLSFWPNVIVLGNSVTANCLDSGDWGRDPELNTGSGLSAVWILPPPPSQAGHTLPMSFFTQKSTDSVKTLHELELALEMKIEGQPIIMLSPSTKLTCFLEPIK